MTADEGEEFAALPEVETRHVDEHEQDRPQRPVLVRVGQEVQEVPRGVRWPNRSSSSSVPERVSKLRDQLKLLADYL